MTASIPRTRIANTASVLRIVTSPTLSGPTLMCGHQLTIRLLRKTRVNVFTRRR